MDAMKKGMEGMKLEKDKGEDGQNARADGVEEEKLKAPQPPAKFCVNERVLCFQGPQLYEGKVMRIAFEKEFKEWNYWIHYMGWSKSCDEWVYEAKVLKYNKANLDKQKDLRTATDAAIRDQNPKAPKKKASKGKKKSVGNDSSPPVMDEKANETVKTKPGKNDFVESESHFKLKQEICIVIPDKLKLFMVDDWNSVTNQKRLVILPARVTIEQIFTEYLKEKKSEKISIDFCKGLRKYFNDLIEEQLLYRFEKEQFQQMHTTNEEKKPMTEIYGAAHLLRLFSRLGSFLAFTTLDPEGIEKLQKCIKDFFMFMLKNYDNYFTLADYGVSCPES